MNLTKHTQLFNRSNFVQKKSVNRTLKLIFLSECVVTSDASCICSSGGYFRHKSVKQFWQTNVICELSIIAPRGGLCRDNTVNTGVSGIVLIVSWFFSSAIFCMWLFAVGIEHKKQTLSFTVMSSFGSGAGFSGFGGSGCGDGAVSSSEFELYPSSRACSDKISSSSIIFTGWRISHPAGR